MATIELVQTLTQDLQFKRGDTFKTTWIAQASGIDFTTSTVEMEWKTSYDATAALSYSSADPEITITVSTTTTTGDTIQIDVEIGAAVTEALAPAATETTVYLYDIETRLSGGQVYTFFDGNILMTPDVTNP